MPSARAARWAIIARTVPAYPTAVNATTVKIAVTGRSVSSRAVVRSSSVFCRMTPSARAAPGDSSTIAAGAFLFAIGASIARSKTPPASLDAKDVSNAVSRQEAAIAARQLSVGDLSDCLNRLNPLCKMIVLISLIVRLFPFD